MSEREKTLNRIRALLSKTTAQGATEEEAMAAFAKAAELMAKYDVAEKDLDTGRGDKGEGARKRTEQFDPDFDTSFNEIVLAVDELCSVTCIWDRLSHMRFNVYGVGPDVDVAVYLLDLCSRALRHSYDREAKAQGWTILVPNRRRRLKISFIDGMARRLAARLSELAWARHKATSSALVPAKAALVKEAIRRDGRVRFTEPGFREIDPAAAAMGSAAAEKVALDPAIGRTWEEKAALDGINDGEGERP